MATEADSHFWTIIAAVVSAVLKICLLIAVGMGLELKGKLDGPKRKCLSGLAMDVCLPCLMFAHVLPEANVALLIEGCELLLVPLMYSAVGAAVGLLCCLAVGAPKHAGVIVACVAFPNVNGFPVSIISALGEASLPNAPHSHFSAMVFLSLVQLTDGLVKYTVGPAILRRDRRRMLRQASTGGEIPLGASMASLPSLSPKGSRFDKNPTVPLDGSDKSFPPSNEDLQPTGRSVSDPHSPSFLSLSQVGTVQPEWSRQDSYMLFSTVTRYHSAPAAIEPLLSDKAGIDKAGTDKVFGAPERSCSDKLRCIRELFPPQVVAVILALGIGVGPPWLKAIFYRPGPSEPIPPLGFVYGVAAQLGGGFVPMQMISLGGRILNIAGPAGPLSSGSEAGAGGRSKLLRIAALVSLSRMVLTPMVLYGLARLSHKALLPGGRPLAWWAPALIVMAMPTANNVSTMADLVGAGRSIAAASTAMQLMASPLILSVSLTLLMAGAEEHLASDCVTQD